VLVDVHELAAVGTLAELRERIVERRAPEGLLDEGRDLIAVEAGKEAIDAEDGQVEREAACGFVGATSGSGRKCAGQPQAEPREALATANASTVLARRSAAAR